jgi:hypothetical protein
MHKLQVRKLKSHYQARWGVYRHNQKNINKILLINDLIVLKNLVPGDTLCYECLGEVYRDIIPNLSTTISKQYNNLVLVNNLDFKYKTLDQITEYLENIAHNVLIPGGRIILSFEHKFLIYDRVSVSVESLFSHWTANLRKFRLVKMISLFGQSQPGYGDYFFVLSARD